jgi:serine/threonine-protein kinase
MKVMATQSSSPAALDQIEREVELLTTIESPYVVKVESTVATIGDPPYGAAWLEEYLDGHDLSWHLHEPWNFPATVRLGHQIALGLGPAHAVNVVHCDLSPNNIRVLPSVDYKVMDFGLARHTLDAGVPVAGHGGTQQFFSPEHQHGYSGAPMPASDVFCVGIIMYMALTGEPPIPYTGDDDDYGARLYHAKMVDIGIKRPDLKSDQQAVIRRCLHPQSARRYLNAQRLADALGELR